MPWYRMRSDMPGALEGGMFHLKRDRRLTTPPCSLCGYIGERQCDWIINRNILIHGEPKRCDRWLCRHCTTEPERHKDLCPQHAAAWKAVLAGRTNSTDGDGP